MRRLLHRSGLGTLALALAATLLTLLAAELVLRLLDLRGHHEPRKEPGKLEAMVADPAQRVPGVRTQYQPYARFSHVYESDPRGYFGPGHRIFGPLVELLRIDTLNVTGELAVAHFPDLDEDEVYAELEEVIHEFSSNYEHHFDKLLLRLGEEHTAHLNRALVVAAGVAAYHDTKFSELHPFPGVHELFGELHDGQYALLEGQAN